MTDLVERLRNAAEAFPENLMAPLLTEAAVAMEAARAEREVIVAEAMKYAGKSGRLEAKVDRMAEALQWYVDNDDTNDGQEGNEFWLAGRDRARALLRDHGQENGD